MPGTSRSGGRNKKSRAEHALTGTGRKDRGTATTSSSTAPPDPPKGRAPIPLGLTGHALGEWKRMADRLALNQTGSIVDDAALYQYCTLFAETEAIVVAHRTNVALVVKLQRAIDKLTNGDQIVEAIGHIVQLKKLETKYSAQLRQGHMALRQYLVELGMTPAARSRVTPAPDATPPAAAIDRFTKPKA